MAASDTVGITPYEASVRQAEQEAAVQGILDTITQSSQEMMAASQGPQILPGTGGETVGSLLQKRQGDLQAQRMTQKVAQATDWENLAVVLGQDISQLAHQQRAVTQKIMEDSAVSFWDSPADALINAFTLPWDQQALEGINTKLDTTKKMMDAAHSHVQQSAKTADVIATRITEASLAEVATAAEALQVRTAAEARLQAAKTGADGIKFAMEMDKNQLDLYLKQKNLEQSEEQMAMARRREARQMQILDKQLAEIKDKEALDGEHLRFVNAALIQEGKNPLDIKTFKTYKGVSAKLLEDLTKKGMELAINGTGNYSHGNTIEDRFAWQRTVGWTPKTEQQTSVMLMQQQAVRAAADATNNKSMIPVNANAMFKKQFTEGQGDIREGSPFMAPSFKVLSSAKIAANPIWQKYIAPTITEATANTPVTPQLIANTVAQAVANREITSAQAAEFGAAVFQQAIAINNEVHQFKRIAGADQTKYGARIKVGVNPTTAASLDVVGATGAALAASGVGIKPGLALMGVSAGGRLLMEDRASFDAADRVQWNAIIARQVASRMGYSGLIPSVSVDPAALGGTGSGALAPAITVESGMKGIR